jgi:hypothetical protein
VILNQMVIKPSREGVKGGNPMRMALHLRPCRREGNAPIRRKRGNLAAAGAGAAPAAGVMTLAPAFGQALPSLAGIRTDYTHETNRELLFQLCAALVREGLGDQETWNQAQGSAIRFAQTAIMRGIGAERDKLLTRNVEYHLQVTDALERYGDGVQLGSGRLAVLIECGGSGYLKIGPAIEAMEAEAEGLGAAFYWTLTHALYKVMRLYNHDDALMYEEQMREWAAQDDEENQGQYEFPEVEKALPECIRKTLKRDHREGKAHDRALLRQHRKGRFKDWIGRLRRIEQLARLPLKQSREYIEDGYYDQPPLPCLLICFKEQDAIVACFDEESQSMLETTSEPALCTIFSPAKPAEVHSALRIVARFVQINAELFSLVESIHAAEAHHGDPSLNRSEPSLRAA